MRDGRVRLGVGMRLVVALAGIVGLGIQIAHAKLENGQLFYYYTTQSNLIITVVFLCSAVQLWRGSDGWKWLAVVERSAHLWVYVTGIVFHLLLSRYWNPDGLRGVGNVLLHYVVPIGAFLAWLVCHQKGRYRMREIGIWASYPVLYLTFTLIRGHFVGFYPYWFLDPGTAKQFGIGPGAALVIIFGGLTFGFVVLGVTLTALDRLLARRGNGAG
jgi:hypothetical protein